MPRPIIDTRLKNELMKVYTPALTTRAPAERNNHPQSPRCLPSYIFFMWQLLSASSPHQPLFQAHQSSSRPPGMPQLARAGSACRGYLLRVCCTAGRWGAGCGFGNRESLGFVGRAVCRGSGNSTSA